MPCPRLAHLQSLLRKYERELKRLRAELEERSRNLVDKRQLLFVEGERRRAEADKMAAIRALEVTKLRRTIRVRVASRFTRRSARIRDTIFAIGLNADEVHFDGNMIRHQGCTDEKTTIAQRACWSGQYRAISRSLLAVETHCRTSFLLGTLVGVPTRKGRKKTP